MADLALTPGQRALLESALLERLGAVEAAVQAQQGGATRAEFARQLLSDDPDAPREHEGDREVALERSDLLAEELRAISEALLRLRSGDGRYGECEDCGAAVAFDRLRAQPMAARCLDCQARAEA